MFQMASDRHPGEAELHVAVGVLHHLGRQYSPAIEAFERALKLRPGDYSLWNKLGATLANNARRCVGGGGEAWPGDYSLWGRCWPRTHAGVSVRVGGEGGVAGACFRPS